MSIGAPRRAGAHVGKAVHVAGRWGSALVPQALAFTTFLGGVILLFSGATPAVLGAQASRLRPVLLRRPSR